MSKQPSESLTPEEDNRSELERVFDDLELYVIQNREGKFFRAKGYGGYGDTWVDDIKKAKVYAKLGPPRAQVSYFAGHYPDFGVPNILRLRVGRVEILDESERVKKAMEKRVRDEKARVKNAAAWNLSRAQRDLDAAQKALDDLIAKQKGETK